MKFDVVVGNPPYQEDSVGESTSNAPVYNYFMDMAYNLAEKAILITPARFLFNAGATSKIWNEKMLKDTHLKVLFFESDAKRVFPTTSIPGGVAITYHDLSKKFSPISIFTPNPIVTQILDKIIISNKTLDSLVSGRGVYKLSRKALLEIPEIEKIQSKGHSRDVGTGAFNIMNEIVFFDEEQHDGEYVKIYGLKNSKRTFMWMKKSYLDYPDSFTKYKVFISKANGAALKNKSIVGAPVVAEKNVGATETFITIGGFDTEIEAENLAKYIKTKFVRFLVSVLKVTPNNTRDTWTKVPIQNFTNQSDILWNNAILEIDRQLFNKYGLDENEIVYISENIKEMI